MKRSSERFHADENRLCRSCMTELEGIYAELSLSEAELHLLGTPRRMFTVNFPVRMSSGETRMFIGHRVHYTDARGPSKGGIRFHPELTVEHLSDLAFLMGLKCAVMNIPFGGAKGGVVVDPTRLTVRELELVTRGYIRAISGFIGPRTDIPAPDVYTDEKIMAWILDEYEQISRGHAPAVVTGKPVELGGLGAREYSTALGGVHVLEEALQRSGLGGGVRVAIQGFGHVGREAARILHERGHGVVAVSDSKGAILNPDGLDIPRVMEHKRETGSVARFPGARDITNKELLAAECDVLAPAALSAQITSANAGEVRAGVVLELANAPTSPGADEILFSRDVMVIPDVLANAGGVVVSYFEWSQNLSGVYWQESVVLERLGQFMADAFAAVHGLCEGEGCRLRRAAYRLGVERILKAESLRGSF